MVRGLGAAELARRTLVTTNCCADGAGALPGALPGRAAGSILSSPSFPPLKHIFLFSRDSTRSASWRRSGAAS